MSIRDLLLLESALDTHEDWRVVEGFRVTFVWWAASLRRCSNEVKDQTNYHVMVRAFKDKTFLNEGQCDLREIMVLERGN